MSYLSRLRNQEPHGKLQVSPASQSGFTIVELMIATLVFSVVLMVVTFGVLHFTNDYYKGVNSSTTQTTAQNAIDTISQTMQFSTIGTIVGTDGTQGFFCSDNKLFVYALGQQYKGNPSATTGLYEMDKGANCAARAPSGGTELLDKNMRLTAISVSQPDPSANLWQVSLRFAYGDSDLLCDPGIGSPSTPGSCNGADYAGGANVSGNSITCKTQIGSQFCSIAAVTSMAQQRIKN